MTRVSTRSLVDEAVAAGSAVLAFNVITLEHAEAIVAGLDRAGRGGILQLSERAIAYHGHLRPVAAACSELAAAAGVPVSVHLDHVQDAALARRGTKDGPEVGISSIMVDAAHLSAEANVSTTAELAALAHAAGLWVEAELGEIGGKDGAHAPGVRTDPDEARSFVAATGVDGLAVAVGSTHAMTAATASLDLDLIERLAAAVPVPLVLHGSSGVPSQVLREAVARGMRKINVGTALNVALTTKVREQLAASDSLTDPRRYLGAGRDAMAETVARLCAEVLDA